MIKVGDIVFDIHTGYEQVDNYKFGRVTSVDEVEGRLHAYWYTSRSLEGEPLDYTPLSVPFRYVKVLKQEEPDKEYEELLI